MTLVSLVWLKAERCSRAQAWRHVEKAVFFSFIRHHQESLGPFPPPFPGTFIDRGQFQSHLTGLDADGGGLLQRPDPPVWLKSLLPLGYGGLRGTRLVLPCMTVVSVLPTSGCRGSWGPSPCLPQRSASSCWRSHIWDEAHSPNANNSIFILHTARNIDTHTRLKLGDLDERGNLSGRLWNQRSISHKSTSQPLLWAAGVIPNIHILNRENGIFSSFTDMKLLVYSDVKCLIVRDHNRKLK